MSAQPRSADLTDHVHETLADENGSLTPICTFDWNNVCGETLPEDQVPVATASSALMRILDWCAASRDFRFSGAKVHMLKVLLDPINGEFRNISEIAREAQISRAVLSKAFTNLRDTYGIKLIGGKLNSSRAIYREAQLRAVAAGRHSSLTRKNSTETSPGSHDDMNAQKDSSQPRTLDQAKARISELERQLATVATPKPTASPSPPSKAAIPPIKAAQAQASPAPQLSDLNRKELLEVLDAANGAGNLELLRLVYGELQSRRRAN